MQSLDCVLSLLVILVCYSFAANKGTELLKSKGKPLRWFASSDCVGYSVKAPAIC